MPSGINLKKPIETLSVQDQNWYWEQCKQVHNNISYNLDRRQSGISALKLYLIAEKGFSVSDAAVLKDITPEKMKEYLGEMFNAINNPNKTRAENLKNLGRIHKAAIDKLMKYKLPKAESFKKLSDFDKIKEEVNELGRCYIDYTQDLEGIVGPRANAEDKCIYLETQGGQAEFEKLSSKWGAYSQGFGGFFQYLYDENYKDNSKAVAMGLSIDYLKKYDGKAIKDLPSNMTGVYVNLVSMVIMPNSSSILGKDKTTPDQTAYINGEANTYAKKQAHDKKVKEITAQTFETANKSYEGVLRDLCKQNMQAMLAVIPQFDLNTKDLMTLPDDVKDIMLRVYYDTFGTVYRTTLMGNIVEQGSDQFDMIICSNKKTVRQNYGKQYENYTPGEQSTAFILETIRTLIKDPQGVKCKYVSIDGKNNVTVAGEFNVRNSISSININRKINADKARRFLENPALSGDIYEAGNQTLEYFNNLFFSQKRIMENHSMDMFDCIYVGNKTLNEIYEEKYADMFPEHNLDGKILKMGILLAESFNPNTTIFATVLSEDKKGAVIRNTIPLVFEGKKLVPGQSRTDMAATKKEANKILADRKALYSDREKARQDVLRRAVASVDTVIDHPERSPLKYRMATIKNRAAITSPAAREFVRQIENKINSIEKLDSVQYEESRYRAFLRAAKLADDEELKKEFKEEAAKIISRPPLSEYENYLTGLEYAFKLPNYSGAIPSRIQEFFEEKTGYVVPSFTYHTDIAGLSAYRPLEVSLDLNVPLPEEAVINFIEGLMIDARYKRSSDADMDRNTLVGGRTLEELLTEKWGEDYNVVVAKKDRAKILHKALKSGVPVDVFVVVDRGQNKPSISSVPVHVTANGKAYSQLSPKRLQKQKEAYKKVFANNVDDNDKELVKHEKEEDLLVREQRLINNAAKDLENIRHNEFMADLFLHSSPAYYALDNKYYSKGKPKVGRNTVNKLTDQEKEALKGAISPARAVPYGYIALRLAQDSMKLINEGRKGYSIEEIFSVSKLEELKKKYAEEFARVCADNDVETYFKVLIGGSRDLIKLHQIENPPKDMIENEESFDKAFLGANLGVTQTLLDVKQEIGKSDAYSDYMIKLGLFKDRQEVDEYGISLYDYGMAGKTVRNYKLSQYMISNGYRGAADAAYRMEQYDALKQRMTEKVIKGQDPYADLNNYLVDNNALEDSDSINEIPMMSALIENDPAGFIDDYSKGQVHNKIYFDHRKLAAVSAGKESGKLSDYVIVTTPARKKYLDSVQKNVWEKEYIEEKLNATRAARRKIFEEDRNAVLGSGKENPEIAKLYDEIFGAYLSRPIVRAYLEAHPEMDETDLFRMGTMSFKQWAEMNKKTLSTKAMIIEYLSDPEAEIGLMPVIYDEKTGKPELGEVMDIYDSEIREYIISQRPELRNIEDFKKGYIKQYPDISFGGYSDEDWKELYKHEFRRQANEGLIRADRIISKEQLLRESDPDIEETSTFQAIKTVYGAKQKFVKEWANPSEMVYSKNTFREIFKDYDSKQFTNDEFAVLSYYAAFIPELYKPGMLANLGPDATTNEDVLANNITNWTADFNAMGKVDPRYGSGMKYKYTVAPAREKIADTISKYDNGGADEMARVVIKGIQNALSDTLRRGDMSPGKNVMHSAYMLTQMKELLDKHPELKQKVEAGLTPENRKLMNALIRSKEISDAAIRAAKVLKDSEKGNVITADETERCVKAIEANKYYKKLWADNFNTILTFQAVVEANKTLAAGTKKENTDTQNILAQIKFQRALLSNVKPSQKFMDEILSDDFNKTIGDAEINTAQEIRDAIINNTNFYIDSFTASRSEKENTNENDVGYKYKVTPEQVTQNAMNVTASGYRKDEITDILADNLTRAQIVNAGSRYNIVAMEKGWPLFSDSEKLAVNKLLLNQFIVKAENREALKVFYDNIYLELIKDAKLTKKIKAAIDNVKLPTEQPFEKLVEYPNDNLVNDVIKDIKGNKKLKEQQKNDDLLLMQKIHKNLAEIKKNASNFISEYAHRAKAATALSINASTVMNNYKNGKYVGLNEYVKYNFPGNNGYNVVKPEKMLTNFELMEQGTQVSDELIKKVEGIIKKMQDYGIITGESVIEEGYKFYGSKKLVIAKMELIKALKTKDMKKIKAANTAYETELGHVNEIQQMIKEAFPQRDFAPGNVDSIRESRVPAEVSIDIVTNSRFNALYQLGEACIKSKVDVVQFMKNPAKPTVERYKNDVRKHGFDSKVKKSRSFLEAFDNLYEAGHDEKSRGTFEFNVAGGEAAAALGRPMEAFTLLETDKKKVEELSQYTHLVCEQCAGIIRREAQYIKAVYRFVEMGDEVLGDEAHKTFKENMKRAFLNGRKISKADMPIVHANEDGMHITTINPSYDYILAAKDKYNDIIKNYKNCCKYGRECNINGRFLVEEAMFDYLMAHPEDMEKSEYKELEKAANSAAATLGLNSDFAKQKRGAGPTPAEKYAKWKSRFEKEYNKLSTETRDRDKEINKELLQIKKELAGIKTGSPNSAERMRDLIDQFKDIIDRRLKEIAENYKYKEITDSYMQKRSEQLRSYKADMTKPIEKVPKFVSSKQSERARDVKLINDRALDNLWENHLKSLDTYIEYVLKQPENKEMNKEDNTTEEWAASYRNAIHSQQLPEPVINGIENINYNRPANINAEPKQPAVNNVNKKNEEIKKQDPIPAVMGGGHN